MTSSTSGSRSSGSSGPSPNERSATRADERVARGVVEQRGLAVDQRADAPREVRGAVGAGLGEQPRPQRGGDLVEGGGGLHEASRAAVARFSPRSAICPSGV